MNQAILSLSLGFRKLTPWHWNRFIVPLERGAHGILAGHGLLGVQKPGAKSTSSTSCPSPEMVKETLKRRKVINSDTLTPFKVPLPPPSKQEQQKFFEMRDKQWQAFCQRSSNARKSTRHGSWMWRRREAAADDGMAGIFGWIPRLTLDICRETSGSCRVSVIMESHRNHDIQTESWWKQDATQTTETSFQRGENLSKGMRCYRSVSTYYLLPYYVLPLPYYPLPTTYP